MATSVTVRVPATSANLGPGFDCLGLALDLCASIRLDRSGRVGNNDAMASMALIAARRVFSQYGQEPPAGLNATYEGDIPIARGLGASAVARVGGALAANEFAGGTLGREALLALVTELEGHADNVTPALFGGLQVSVVDDDRVLHVGVPLPPALRAVLFDLGPDRRAHLHLTVHHLVIDAVSWRILNHDLDLAYRQALGLPPLSGAALNAAATVGS